MPLPFEKSAIDQCGVLGSTEENFRYSLWNESERELTYRGGKRKEKTVLDTHQREIDTFGE